MSTHAKHFLFVDDNAAFLNILRESFEALSGGSWEIFTAENHSQALAVLEQRTVDAVVLDLEMPMLDGLQFLGLLNRLHPGLPVAMLTGHGSAEKRQACLAAGAALFLEKFATAEGFTGVYAALNALVGTLPSSGFRGIMRRVGLQEVIQMECLSRKSSILEVFADRMRGRIFICDGNIVHAESGSLSGETALYGLLGLQGGGFNLLPFAEPARRTIAGHYEFLLMEAARLSDENAESQRQPLPASPPGAEPELEDSPPAPAMPSILDAARRVEEVLLCSGVGEVLHSAGSLSLERRLGLVAQIEQQAEDLAALLPTGRFDRLEAATTTGRVVCVIQPHMRLLVRSNTGAAQS